MLVLLVAAVALAAGPDDLNGWKGIKFGDTIGKLGMSAPGYPFSGMTAWSGTDGDGLIPGTTCKVRGQLGTTVDGRLAALTLLPFTADLCDCLTAAWGPPRRAIAGGPGAWDGAHVSVVCTPPPYGGLLNVTSLDERAKCQSTYPVGSCNGLFMSAGDTAIKEPPPAPVIPPELVAAQAVAEARNAAQLDARNSSGDPRTYQLPYEIPPFWPRATWPHGPDEWAMYVDFFEVYTHQKSMLTKEEKAFQAQFTPKP